MKLVNEFLVALVWGLGALGCGAAVDGAPELEGETQSTEQELAANALTKKQAATVLKLVDDICGDTWCEGDHNFRFDRIDCTKPCGKAPGSCRLTFRIFSHESDVHTGPTFKRVCKTGAFTGFASLVETSENGYQSLNWDYYDALSTCINRAESNLPAL